MHSTIKTRSGRTLIVPTPEEDAEINRGIAADPDTYELSDEEFAQLPFSDGWHAAERPPVLYLGSGMGGRRPPVG